METPPPSTRHTGSCNGSDKTNYALIAAAWMYSLCWSLIALPLSTTRTNVLTWLCISTILTGIFGGAMDILSNQKNPKIIWLFCLTILHATVVSLAIWSGNVVPATNHNILRLVLFFLCCSPLIYTQVRQLLLTGALKPQTMNTRQLMYAWYFYIVVLMTFIIIGPGR